MSEELEGSGQWRSREGTGRAGEVEFIHDGKRRAGQRIVVCLVPRLHMSETCRPATAASTSTTPCKIVVKSQRIRVVVYLHAQFLFSHQSANL